MNKLIRQKITLGCILATALLVGSQSALADLMLYPHRVVLEGKQRTAQIEIINRGTTTNVYRLKLVRKRMTEIGEFVPVDEALPEELFADDLVRYSPRQIELAPGASQTVRLMVRKPAELADGEYRSHLLFERLPDVTPAGTSVPAPGRETAVAIKLTALVGVSIPVIVRHGQTHSAVVLDDLRLESSPTGEPVLSLDLQRDGTRSVYGDLVADFTPRRGAQRVVGTAKGVAVYAPNPLRRGRLVLHPDSRGTLRDGTIHVTYREPSDSGGKLLAEAHMQVP